MTSVIAIDPSGNFLEGKGTSGIALFDGGNLVDTLTIKASEYSSAEEYWIAHRDTIESISALRSCDLVCESYKLQKHKAMQQSGSWLETPQLIGYLRAIFWGNGMSLVFQDPTIKTRFNDSVLEKLGVIEKKGRLYFRNGKPITMHERDAIRHGMYYIRYGKKG